MKHLLSFAGLALSFTAPLLYADYMAIDLGDNGPTPNHQNSPSEGPNNFQNFPVLTSAVRDGNTVTVTGTLHSVANSQFLIQLYANTANINQGQVLAGIVLTKTNGVNAQFTAVFPHVPGTFFINSTATFLKNSFPTDTSEFGTNIPIVEQPHSPYYYYYETEVNRKLYVQAPGVLVNVHKEIKEATAKLVRNAYNGDVTLESDGSFTYKPHCDFVGTDSFTFVAVNEGVSSHVATAVIKVEKRCSK